MVSYRYGGGLLTGVLVVTILACVVRFIVWLLGLLF